MRKLHKANDDRAKLLFCRPRLSGRKFRLLLRLFYLDMEGSAGGGSFGIRYQSAR